MKNTHGGMLLSVIGLKFALLHGRFSRFLNYTNGTKSRNASQMFCVVFLLDVTRRKSFPMLLDISKEKCLKF